MRWREKDFGDVDGNLCSSYQGMILLESNGSSANRMQSKNN